MSKRRELPLCSRSRNFEYGHPNVQFVFPLTKNILVLVNSLCPDKINYGVLPQKWVHIFNEAQAISAEKHVFASQPYWQQMVEQYSNVVPIQQHLRIPQGSGYLQIMQPGLGPPHKLPRWNSEEANHTRLAQKAKKTRLSVDIKAG